MVPACHRLYYNVNDFGAKSHLRTLRTFWKSEFDSLEASILEIVDATALCAVIDEEARVTASEIKKRTYAQVKIRIMLGPSKKAFQIPKNDFNVSNILSQNLQKGRLDLILDIFFPSGHRMVTSLCLPARQDVSDGGRRSLEGGGRRRLQTTASG